MQSLRVLIVDDEPPARARLRRLLAQQQDAQVIGESCSGCEAVAAIRQTQPDVVFLDVQMPDLDGLGVVAEIGADAMPAVVFVTAFDHYALRAFEIHALDYLLKPFDDERFATSLARARDEVRRRQLDGLRGKLMALLADGHEAAPAPPPSPATQHAPPRLMIRSAGRVRFVDVDEIDWIEAAGSYVRLHTSERSHLLRQTLQSLETKLDDERFLRIHRSTIVNGRRIREMRALSHGEARLILHDGTELKVSRSYREHLERRLLGG